MDSHRRTGFAASRVLAVGCAVTGAFAGLTSTTCADVTGLEAVHWIKEINGTDYHVTDVYASCEHEQDKVLLVWNTAVVLVGAPGATFYNTPLPGGIETARPICWDPSWEPEWEVDTYFAIGGEQCDTSGVQWLTPDCPTDLFVNTGAVSTTGGWLNSPPTLGCQHAGPDFRVRLIRLCVREEDWVPDSQIVCAWTIAWLNNDVPGSKSANFGGYWTMPSEAPAEGPPDQPGEPTPPSGGGGGGGYTPPEAIGSIEGADLVWLSESGWVVGWNITGSLALEEPACVDQVVPSYLEPAGRGDLDGDGDEDLLFRSELDQSIEAWIMQDGVIDDVVEVGTVPQPMPWQWELLGVADLSADGKADIVWRRNDTGNRNVLLWRMDGTEIVSAHQLGISAGFEFLGLGDLNNDHRADLLWRNPSAQVFAWRMNPSLNRTTVLFGNVPSIDPSWQVETLADLDGDGDADVIWHNLVDSQVNGWIVNNLARSSGGPIAYGVPASYRVMTARDLDGDGDQDLVWRQSGSGSVNAWTMTGLTKETGSFVSPSPTAWLGW